MLTRLTLFQKTTIGLVLVAMILAIATTISPIRIRRVMYDKTALTTSYSPRVIVETNRNITEVSKEQIAVSPEHGFDVKTAGSNVIIEFIGALDNAETYAFVISNVVEEGSDKTATLRFSVQTREPDLFYLNRGDGSEESKDKIVKSSVDGANESDWFSSDRISEFCLAGENIAILTVDQNNQHQLVLKNIRRGTEEVVQMPGLGQASLLEANIGGSVIGFTFIDESMPATERTPRLYFYDTEAKIYFSLKGLDGNYLSTYSWAFAPDGETVALVTTKGDLIATNINDEEIIPFGSASEVTGFSSDGESIIVGDNLTPFAVSLKDASRKELSQFGIVGARVLSAKPASMGEEVIFAKIGSYVSDTDFSISIYGQTAISPVKEVLKINTQEEALIDYYSSPSGKYLFVETSVINGARYDNYPMSNYPYNTTTRILDVRTGQEVSRLDGIKVLPL